MGDEAEQAAAGLWSRFRDIALALRRWQDFNFSAEGGEGRFADRWLEGLLREAGGLDGVGRELVLRAFRGGADAVNFEILTRLHDEEAVALSDLARATRLPHFTVSERVNDLVQVGLAVRVLEQDAARATSLARGFLGIVGDVEQRLIAKIREGLPGLIGP